MINIKGVSKTIKIKEEERKKMKEKKRRISSNVNRRFY